MPTEPRLVVRPGAPVEITLPREMTTAEALTYALGRVVFEPAAPPITITSVRVGDVELLRPAKKETT